MITSFPYARSIPNDVSMQLTSIVIYDILQA